MNFLSKLVEQFSEINWSDEEISTTIRTTAAKSGISARESYTALYLAMLGRKHGPKASALILEIGRKDAVDLLSS